MIFCVSLEPYHQVYGSSAAQIKQLFQQLENSQLPNRRKRYVTSDNIYPASSSLLIQRMPYPNAILEMTLLEDRIVIRV